MDWATRITVLILGLAALVAGHPRRMNLFNRPDPNPYGMGMMPSPFPDMFHHDQSFDPVKFSDDFWQNPDSYSGGSLPHGFNYEHTSSHDGNTPHKESYHLSNSADSPVHIEKQYESTSNVKPGRAEWRQEMHQSYNYHSPPGNMGSFGSQQVYPPYGASGSNQHTNLDKSDIERKNNQKQEKPKENLNKLNVKLSDIEPSNQAKEYSTTTAKVKRMDSDALSSMKNGEVEPIIYPNESENMKSAQKAAENKNDSENLNEAVPKVNKSKDTNEQKNVNSGSPVLIPVQIVPWSGQVNGNANTFLVSVPNANTAYAGNVPHGISVPASAQPNDNLQILYATVPNNQMQLVVPLTKEPLPTNGNPVSTNQAQSAILSNGSSLKGLMPDNQQSSLDLNRNQQYSPSGAQIAAVVLPSNTPISLPQTNSVTPGNNVVIKNVDNLLHIAKNADPVQAPISYNQQPILNQQQGNLAPVYNQLNGNVYDPNQGSLNGQPAYVLITNSGQTANVQPNNWPNQNNLQPQQATLNTPYTNNGRLYYVQNQPPNQQGNLLYILPNGQNLDQGNAYTVPQNNLPNLNNLHNQGNMYTLVPVNSVNGQNNTPNSYAGNAQGPNGYQVLNAVPYNLAPVNNNPNQLSVTKDQVD